MTDRLESLAAELRAFCAREGLPLRSADEFGAGETTPAQAEWLAGFVRRWDEAIGAVGHPPVLVLGGGAYTLLDDTLYACAVPIDAPIPRLLAGYSGMALYTINDEWCEVDLDLADDPGEAQRALAILQAGSMP